jgi:TonB family protein
VKRPLLIILCLLAAILAKAQTHKSDLTDIDKIEIKEPGDSAKLKNNDSLSKLDRLLVTEEKVDIEPQFPGGIEAFYNYLSHNIHYPKDAIKNLVQGKVILSFVIERNGSITDIKIIRGLSDDINSEAIRIISNSPKWNPGIQNGRAVRVQYRMPIDFHF